MKVGVIGASGYAGVELLRLCTGHPSFDVVVASAGSHAGERVADHTPSLAAAYPRLSLQGIDSSDVSALDGLDVVFLALPHGQSQHLVPHLIDRVGVIVDLAADFRLSDPALYPRWYGAAHSVPELLPKFVYGLVERHRDELRTARLIAAPGCYPTAAILALGPLVDAGVVETGAPGVPGIIVDAASGVSGAGRAATPQLHFGAVAEDFVAYGLLDHRHTAEMEESLGALVLFTPHLAPMVRGILATCYARPSAQLVPAGHPVDGALTTADVVGILGDRYRDDPFVVVTDQPPSTKATSGSNCVHVTARVDPRTGWVLALAALDNLTKGASGQAIQCANLAVGLPEETGLPTVGVYP